MFSLWWINIWLSHVTLSCYWLLLLILVSPSSLECPLQSCPLPTSHSPRLQPRWSILELTLLHFRLFFRGFFSQFSGSLLVSLNTQGQFWLLEFGSILLLGKGNVSTIFRKNAISLFITSFSQRKLTNVRINLL